MDLKQLYKDDKAVSPVIGVILMVAITVILAAVIASFVLGLGDTAQQTTPQASFSFDYSESDDTLSVVHDGGDSIPQNELYLRGDNFDSSVSGTDMGSAGQWAGSTSSGSNVVAGDSVDVGVTSSYNIRVVYETVEGDSSATLGQDEGPDA